MRLKLAAWGSTAAAVVVGLLLVAGASASGGPAVNLDQCANGSDASSSCPPNWQNGDLNPQNSQYAEGTSVPFRLQLSGLDTEQTHTLVIQFDTTKSGKHAYDYLTSYDRTVTGVDACDGCSGTLSTWGPIPLPTNPAPTGASVVADADRQFSIWGGTISDVQLGGDSSDVAGQDQSMTITFSADQADVVLAWGGHVAAETPWGPDSGAGAIPGSPYHMRVISLDDAAGGQQDRQMKTLDTPSIQTDPVGDEESQTVTDNALLTGNGKNAVDGTLSFFLCYSAIGTPDCSSGGVPAGADVAVSNLGTASSDAISPSNGGGTYCFRAEYTPSKNAKYTAASETNQLVNNNDGNHGECFTVEGAPTTTLTLDKVVVNDNGGTAHASDFTLTATAGEQVLSGSGPEAGPFDASPDTAYTLSESGPSGYTAGAWACEGGSLDGSVVTVQAGDHATCTITNDDIAPIVTTTTTTTTTTPPQTPTPAPPSIDLAITKAVAPTGVNTGGTATWTETITNNGPDAATGVKVADAQPVGLTIVSVQT